MLVKSVGLYKQKFKKKTHQGLNFEINTDSSIKEMQLFCSRPTDY